MEFLNQIFVTITTDLPEFGFAFSSAHAALPTKRLRLGTLLRKPLQCSHGKRKNSKGNPLQYITEQEQLNYNCQEEYGYGSKCFTKQKHYDKNRRMFIFKQEIRYELKFILNILQEKKGLQPKSILWSELHEWKKKWHQTGM